MNKTLEELQEMNKELEKIRKEYWEIKNAS